MRSGGCAHFKNDFGWELLVCWPSRSARLQVCKSASLQVCKSASLQVCKSASLQVCSLQLSHTVTILVQNFHWNQSTSLRYLMSSFSCSDTLGKMQMRGRYAKSVRCYKRDREPSRIPKQKLFQLLKHRQKRKQIKLALQTKIPRSSAFYFFYKTFKTWSLRHCFESCFSCYFFLSKPNISKDFVLLWMALKPGTLHSQMSWKASSSKTSKNQT